MSDRLHATLMHQDVVNVILSLDITNGQLLTHMRMLKAFHEQGKAKFFTCTISGFDDDPRDLGIIPEVIAFARRLIGVGFTALLDPTTALNEKAPRHVKAALGHVEVWLIGEGLFQGNVTISPPLMDRAKEAFFGACAAAEAKLGPCYFLHGPK